MTVRERALDVLSTLRPQPYGTGHPSRISDPLVEPLWTGIRVLAAVEGGELRLNGVDGAAVDAPAEVAAALVDATRGEPVILDGYLTIETSRDGVGIDPGLDDAPSMGTFMTQSLLGSRPNRGQEATERAEQVREATTFGEEDQVGFVAVDLVWLDGEPIFDVPLLERKRLLETVITESELIRLGVFVRPPIDTWVASWRALGFVGLSFRAANSRYAPGEKRKDWTTSWMPRR